MRPQVGKPRHRQVCLKGHQPPLVSHQQGSLRQQVRAACHPQPLPLPHHLLLVALLLRSWGLEGGLDNSVCIGALQARERRHMRA